MLRKPHKSKQYLPVAYHKVDKLKSLLIKSGKKERTNSFLLKLLTLVKHQTKKDPFIVLDTLLFKLAPGFILRRTFVAGKLFNLPVPISDNHAFFMGADYLRKAAFRNTKTFLTVPYLLFNEIKDALQHKGGAYESLKAYIDIALDHRPFSRYIRKKKKVISRSQKGRAFLKLRKLFKRKKKIIRLKKGKLNALKNLRKVPANKFYKKKYKKIAKNL